MSSHFLVYFFAIIAWQISDFMENRNKQPQIFLSFLNMQMVLTNSTPGDLSMFDEVRVLE